MKHHKKNRKFGRETGQRKALLRSLTRSLVVHGKIKTTEAKAKEIRPMVEKMITRGKNPTLANHRLLISNLAGDTRTAKKVETIAQKYTDRAGGYLRIVKMGARKGDGAEMAVIEFV